MDGCQLCNTCRVLDGCWSHQKAVYRRDNHGNRRSVAWEAAGVSGCVLVGCGLVACDGVSHARCATQSLASLVLVLASLCADKRVRDKVCGLY